MFVSFTTHLHEIFPTKWSLFIFITYMALFVTQGILVKSSQRSDNTYSYNVASVVLCSEFLKLLICICLYLKEKTSIRQLIFDLRAGLRIGALYLIPAFLYCLYNNLSFVNLANYDPTSYFILLQLRNVITGILYQVIFRKKLSALQWFSLIILTAGCIVKELGRTSTATTSNSTLVPSFFSIHLFLILVQIFCSCFAGVYNEYLLKDSGASVHILVQNIYMYLDSMACNLMLLLLTTSPNSLDSLFDLSFLSEPLVVCLLVNGALAGITTSFFLKSLNSILKSFAATLEIILTALVCFFLFDTPIDRYTLLSIGLIFGAVYLYTQAPLPATKPTPPSKADLYKDSDKEDLKVLITK